MRPEVWQVVICTGPVAWLQAIPEPESRRCFSPPSRSTPTLADRLTPDPLNAGWQTALAASLVQAGSQLAGCGDTDGALQHCSRALQIFEGLVGCNREGHGAGRLAAGLLQRGRFAGARGDATGASEPRYTLGRCSIFPGAGRT